MSSIDLDDLPDVPADADLLEADVSEDSLGELEEALAELIDVDPSASLSSLDNSSEDLIAALAASSMQPPPTLNIWQVVMLNDGSFAQMKFEDEAEVVEVTRKKLRLLLDSGHEQHSSPPSDSVDTTQEEEDDGESEERKAASELEEEVEEDEEEEDERVKTAGAALPHDGLHVAYEETEQLHSLSLAQFFPSSDASHPPSPPSPIERLVAYLLGLSAEERTSALAESLYPHIAQHQPQLAGRITRLLLQQSHAVLIALLVSPEKLRDRAEAIAQSIREGEVEEEEKGRADATPLYECTDPVCWFRLARRQRERLLSEEARAGLIFRRAAAPGFNKMAQTTNELLSFTPFLRAEPIEAFPLEATPTPSPPCPLVGPFLLFFFHERKDSSAPHLSFVYLNSSAELRCYVLTQRRLNREGFSAIEIPSHLEQRRRQLLTHFSEAEEEIGEEEVRSQPLTDANTLRLVKGELSFHQRTEGFFAVLMVAAFQRVEYLGFLSDELEDIQTKARERWSASAFQPTDKWKAANEEYRQMMTSEDEERMAGLMRRLMAQRAVIRQRWSDRLQLLVDSGVGFTTAPTSALVEALKELRDWVEEDRRGRQSHPDLLPLHQHCHRLWLLMLMGTFAHLDETFAELIEGILLLANEELLYGGEGWSEAIELIQDIRRE